MASIRSETIEGINHLIEDQKLDEGSCHVTLTQFDTVQVDRVVFAGLPIDEFRPLTQYSFRPRGGTPLYDAIGLALSATARRTEGQAETLRIFVIVTDGMENASTRVSVEEVRDRIQRKEAEGWRFIFMGANQDAILEADKIGIDAGRALTYGIGPEEVRRAHFANATLVREMKAGRRESFTEGERTSAKD